MNPRITVMNLGFSPPNFPLAVSRVSMARIMNVANLLIFAGIVAYFLLFSYPWESRHESQFVAGIEGHFPYVLLSRQDHGQPLHPQAEPRVRRHPVVEDLQVVLEGLRL